MHLIVLRIETHAAGIVSLHRLSLLHGLLLLLLHPARLETQIVRMTVFILIPLIPLLLMLLVRPVGTICVPITRIGIVCREAVHLVQTGIRPVSKPKSDRQIHFLLKDCQINMLYILPVMRCLHVREMIEGTTMLVVARLIGKLIAIAVLRKVEEDIVQRAILARAD